MPNAHKYNKNVPQFKQTQIFFCCIALSQYYRIKTCQGRRDTLRTRRHATSGHRVQMKLKFCCYNHTTSCPTLRVTPSWRKQGNPPCMSTEKAANAKLTERNLETTFKVRMFSVWCNRFGNAFSVYQKLSPLLLQVREHKVKNGNMSVFITLPTFYEKLSTMMEFFNHEVYYSCAVTHANGYFYVFITKTVD